MVQKCAELRAAAALFFTVEPDVLRMLLLAWQNL
jgi:hypothetical protein